MSAKEKGEYKDNGWFVGVTPRRNPEIVVACLFEGGEHGALAARVAAKVIEAYVREAAHASRRMVAKANGAPETSRPKSPRFGTRANAQNPDKLQAGHFNVPTPMARSKPVAAAPGCRAACKPVRGADCKPPNRTPRWRNPNAMRSSSSRRKPS